MRVNVLTGFPYKSGRYHLKLVGDFVKAAMDIELIDPEVNRFEQPFFAATDYDPVKNESYLLFSMRNGQPFDPELLRRSAERLKDMFRESVHLEVSRNDLQAIDPKIKDPLLVGPFTVTQALLFAKLINNINRYRSVWDTLFNDIRHTALFSQRDARIVFDRTRYRRLFKDEMVFDPEQPSAASVAGAVGEPQGMA